MENLVTHRSQKFWLSRDCPSNTLKKTREQCHYRRYILDIGHPRYSYLTAVKTRYQLTIFVGSGLELIEVACFLFACLFGFFFKLTVDPVQVFRLECRFKSGYCSGEKVGLLSGSKFRCRLSPGVLLTFLPTYSLHNHLFQSSWVRLLGIICQCN